MFMFIWIACVIEIMYEVFLPIVFSAKKSTGAISSCSHIFILSFFRFFLPPSLYKNKMVFRCEINENSRSLFSKLHCFWGCYWQTNDQKNIFCKAFRENLENCCWKYPNVSHFLSSKLIYNLYSYFQNMISFESYI